ncbi:methyl-accepting chemotaxis protein [Halodesulfovibrio spirochaetisodalis]|uniref:Methyl-accepting transducer domain-containing protein n=1 Tax=Halodesulfovibrio spirochaetisodalis TaxID=1560234 RepID=A0A1B7XDJ8_9BACT|nr:methyl-accepting chemotaxis protein [Halodesulfovibrio spirochaetisodalis]OBQ52133.1 hypothetical protein SP90_08120 [Halodesulfovibrio spirochaetisodalis]
MKKYLFWRGTASELGKNIVNGCVVLCAVAALAGGVVGYGLGSGQVELAGYQVVLSALAAGVILLLLVGAWVSVTVCNPLVLLFNACEEAAQNGFVFEKNIRGNVFFAKFSCVLERVFYHVRGQMEETENVKKEAFKESRKTVRALRKAEKEAEKASSSRAEAFVHAAEQLEGVATGLNENSRRLFALMSEVTKGAVEQKDDLDTASNSMEEITAAAKDISITTSTTAENAKGTIHVAEQSADVVNNNLRAVEEMKTSHAALQKNMDELSTQAAKISGVIELIEDVADQTNLLALNAAIEAARAGDAGRGFAVVADEVRKLAERTVTATADVRKIIFSISDVIKENVSSVAQTSGVLEDVYELSHKSGKSLKEIVELAESASANNEDIATAVEQQVSASGKMGSLVHDISRVSQHTVDISTQASDAVEFVTSHTKTLCTIIDEFTRLGKTDVREQ